MEMEMEYIREVEGRIEKECGRHFEAVHEGEVDLAESREEDRGG
jgi:hypothetical protein